MPLCERSERRQGSRRRVRPAPANAAKEAKKGQSPWPGPLRVEAGAAGAGVGARRHQTAAAVGRALATRRTRFCMESTGGRSSERWCYGRAKEAKKAKKGGASTPAADLSS